MPDWGFVRQPHAATPGPENLQKAYELRDRVSEREKLRISANYYYVVTGELEKETQTYELWVQAILATRFRTETWEPTTAAPGTI